MELVLVLMAAGVGAFFILRGQPPATAQTQPATDTLMTLVAPQSVGQPAQGTAREEYRASLWRHPVWGAMALVLLSLLLSTVRFDLIRMWATDQGASITLQSLIYSGTDSSAILIAAALVAVAIGRLGVSPQRLLIALAVAGGLLLIPLWTSQSITAMMFAVMAHTAVTMAMLVATTAWLGEAAPRQTRAFAAVEAMMPLFRLLPIGGMVATDAVRTGADAPLTMAFLVGAAVILALTGRASAGEQSQPMRAGRLWADPLFILLVGATLACETAVMAVHWAIYTFGRAELSFVADTAPDIVFAAILVGAILVSGVLTDLMARGQPHRMAGIASATIVAGTAVAAAAAAQGSLEARLLLMLLAGGLFAAAIPTLFALIQAIATTRDRGLAAVIPFVIVALSSRWLGPTIVDYAIEAQLLLIAGVGAAGLVFALGVFRSFSDHR